MSATSPLSPPTKMPSSTPVLWLQGLFEILTAAFIRLPIWVLLALPKGTRPRPSWSIGRTLQLRVLNVLFSPPVAVFLKTFSREPDYRVLEQGKGVKGVWVPPVPHLIVGKIKLWAEKAGVESIRIPAYWLEKKGVDLPVNARPSEGEKVLYVLHGGGYARQSAHPNDLIANNPRGILEHTSPTIRRAFMIEYRNSRSPSQPPSSPFPSALLDAIAGYHYLVNQVGFAPENIILEGDSAGGNLSMALVRYLLEYKNTSGLPDVPSALVLISPWSDIYPDPNNRTSTFYTNSGSDFVSGLVQHKGSGVLNFLGPLGPEAAVTNPYISPASLSPSMPPVSFTGYPRTLIISGSTELLLDQIRELHKRMKATAGLDVRYVEFVDAWHDFTLLPNFEPQRSEALKLIGSWIEQ
ncbi:alpha/beta-hydrolase [Irpex rosettiformis]|uniref:Alpha/beta-hydrolase n=1 Tax=Irpex rosettiformis TaxID=378272 RepID=A0ACB8UHG4_9APHY|nr:alpha/beta-hydrolase [Irpex rosettiformis]